MFILSLKVILAFVLTVHSVCLSCLGSTNQTDHSSEKSVNSSDGMFAKDSWSGEESKIILSWYYDKMKTSISARKLFTLVWVMVLLAVQYVDYETTLYAVRTNHLIGECSSFLEMDKSEGISCLWNAWEKNLFFLHRKLPTI